MAASETKEKSGLDGPMPALKETDYPAMAPVTLNTMA